jgi:putative YphP/YqiW family bacilliredoxin
MYPESIVKPMKEELVAAGFDDCYSAEAVKNAITSEGTVLMVVNSVCGCAAGAARRGRARGGLRGELARRLQGLGEG